MSTMDGRKDKKLNNLLLTWHRGTVQTVRALEGRGYSRQLLDRYKKSQWIIAVGKGAVALGKDETDYLGGLYALQTQLHLDIHPGGKTALGLLKLSHYVEFSPNAIQLFGGETEKQPSWFRENAWGSEITYYASSFLPAGLALREIQHKSFSVKVSSAARAILEMLYLAKNDQDILECYENLENLNTLRPVIVQSLLENCRSIKVKRLFLYMADKAGHEWVSALDLNTVDLGSGKRSLTTNGVYVDKFQITVPRILHGYDEDYVE
jgi:hypothetical protein